MIKGRHREKQPKSRQPKKIKKNHYNLNYDNLFLKYIYILSKDFLTSIGKWSRDMNERKQYANAFNFGIYRSLRNYSSLPSASKESFFSLNSSDQYLSFLYLFL